MNRETLERALEAIADAKREIIRTEANKANSQMLEDAYAGLSKAELAIWQLIEPKA